MDSKVTLTHHKRNDAGWEEREEGRKTKRKKEGRKKHIFTGGSGS